MLGDDSFQKGLFRDRVLISPKTEKALAAAVTKLMAPMALVACREKNSHEEDSGGIPNNSSLLCYISKSLRIL